MASHVINVSTGNLSVAEGPRVVLASLENSQWTFLLSISVFVFSFFSLLFLFGSARQIKLATRQLLGARKYSYRIVSYRIAAKFILRYTDG